MKKLKQEGFQALDENISNMVLYGVYELYTAKRFRVESTIQDTEGRGVN